MNPRLSKEFRPLLLPWSVASLAAAVYLVKLVDPDFAKGDFGGFLQGFAVFAFGFGSLLLAVLPFGLELQHRTLPLLVGQPMERSRLWREKLLVSAAAVLALGIIHFAALYAAARGDLTLRPLPLCGMLVVATICSGAFNALTVRSIIGGMVSAAGSLFTIVLLVTYACYKVLGREVEPDEWPVTLVFVGVGAAYSAFVLWLGWRTFASLEMREGPGSPNLMLPQWVTRRNVWMTLFRCQSTGALRNLVRKEIGLQNPVFLIALVYSACWLVALVVFALQPERQELFQGIFGGLTGAYIPIVVLVSPCVAFGEEKTLGLAAWHLTLPLSACRQWLIKLSVAGISALLVGGVLPFVLACITLFKTKVGLVALPSEFIWMVASALLVTFVLGVWCASLWENTLRSAVATILSILGLGTCANLAGWWASRYDGLQANLISNFLVRHQLPPPDFLAADRARIFTAALVVIAVLVVALVQSLAQFRRTQTQTKVTLKGAAFLALLTFSGMFWCMDLARSVIRQPAQFESELFGALTVLEKNLAVLDRKPIMVTTNELEKTGRVSPRTLAWLQGTQITLTPPNPAALTLSSLWKASVLFPNGRSYSFKYHSLKRINSNPILDPDRK